LGDPVGSNATAVLALTVTGTHKTLHLREVEITSEEKFVASVKNFLLTRVKLCFRYDVAVNL
jgi:hypothetical protein